jgi:hypothetical protein
VIARSSALSLRLKEHYNSRLRPADIGRNLVRVGVNAGDDLSLNGDHGSELREDLSEFCDGGFDRLDGCTALIEVLILRAIEARGQRRAENGTSAARPTSPCC